MFTLLHEAVHLALGSSATCDLHSRGNEDRDRIETFCNAVAGEALVPTEHLLEQPELEAATRRDWADETIRVLATRYRVSREVILRRLLDLELASNSFYRKKRDEYASAGEERKKPSGGNYYRNLRVKYGMPLLRSVIAAYESGKITANEAAAYLRVKVETLGVVLQ
jgi:Zn-dependent peptidase ImmA (M78 family)